MKIQKNIPLASFTTFGIGGPADYLIQAETKEEIIEAISWAKEKKLPIQILGGGSNVLISDKGVRGLVIKIKKEELKIKKNLVYCDAGVSVSKLVNQTVRNSLSGFEYFAGLPGTVGGSIYKNSHWCDRHFSDDLKSVEVLDEKLERKIILRQKLKFVYDWSIFQKKPWIILQATFKLKKADRESLQKTVDEVLQRRRENQPKGKSAGCIFKNPTSLSAGRLIEKVNLKGKQLGDIKISERHANFFINQGRGKAADVMSLIKLTQEKVEKETGIKLQPEIFFLGEF